MCEWCICYVADGTVKGPGYGGGGVDCPVFEGQFLDVGGCWPYNGCPFELSDSTRFPTPAPTPPFFRPVEFESTAAVRLLHGFPHIGEDDFATDEGYSLSIAGYWGAIVLLCMASICCICCFTCCAHCDCFRASLVGKLCFWKRAASKEERAEFEEALQKAEEDLGWMMAQRGRRGGAMNMQEFNHLSGRVQEAKKELRALPRGCCFGPVVLYLVFVLAAGCMLIAWSGRIAFHRAAAEAAATLTETADVFIEADDALDALAASLAVYQMAPGDDGNGTAVAAVAEFACASNASETLVESVRSHAAMTLGLLDETLLLVDGLAATIETAADDASTKLP